MRTLEQEAFWPYVAGVIEGYVQDVRVSFGSDSGDNGRDMRM